MKVFLFNPENDMALADGHAGYTPPKHIRQMRKDLWELPKLWARKEDLVWDGESPLQLQEGDELCPWGWSLALRHQLLQRGVSEALLPTVQELDRLRDLSHRRTAIEALNRFLQEHATEQRYRGNALLCTRMEEVYAAVNRWPESVLKAPWSSSGKGIRRWGTPGTEEWASHIIQQQGSVVVEEWLNKRVDFAMEFWKDGEGNASYLGLSIFGTHQNGAYTGNWLATETEKKEWLSEWVDPPTQEEIARWWIRYLSGIEYRGAVGVDMVVCTDGSICPCIEINWRQTMGMVAILLARKGYRGRFSIPYEKGRFCARLDEKKLL